MAAARRRLRLAAANGLRLIAPFAAGCDDRRPSHPKVGRGHTTPLAPAGDTLLGRRMARHPIRFGIQTAQQGIEWPQMLDLWQKADAWGYDSLWGFDHFYPVFMDPEGPCLEGWTALAALAQATRRARIGLLVSGNSYRHPCVTAKMAATLDHVSGGRLNLGIGAGWFEVEHRAFGIEFKSTAARLAALDEACRIILGMFTDSRTTVHGKHYTVTDAIGQPKPVQKPHPPIMIGGKGRQVLLRIVARYADMWNIGASAEEPRGVSPEPAVHHGRLHGKSAELRDDVHRRTAEEEPPGAEQHLVGDGVLPEAEERLPAGARLRQVLRAMGRELEVDVRVLPREQHGLEHPRVARVAHHDLQLREIARDDVDVAGMAEVVDRRGRPVGGGVDAQRDAELDALRIERIAVPVVGREADHERTEAEPL